MKQINSSLMIGILLASSLPVLADEQRGEHGKGILKAVKFTDLVNMTGNLARRSLDSWSS